MRLHVLFLIFYRTHGYRIYFSTRHCEPREAIQNPVFYVQPSQNAKLDEVAGDWIASCARNDGSWNAGKK
jgi:hypothetical protein